MAQGVDSEWLTLRGPLSQQTFFLQYATTIISVVYKEADNPKMRHPRRRHRRKLPRR
jgi:hypothetical protein